jgi:hypothetical protein
MRRKINKNSINEQHKIPFLETGKIERRKNLSFSRQNSLGLFAFFLHSPSSNIKMSECVYVLSKLKWESDH